MLHRFNDSRTQFGINCQGLNTAEESAACNNDIKCRWVRENVILIGYVNGTADSGLQNKYNAKLRIACNVNWSGSGSSGGLKNFPTGSNLTTCATKFTQFMTSNAVYLKNGIVVFENEPYNGQYFNYSTSSGATTPYTTVADYLAMLAVLIPICHSFGVKCADGATHMTYYSDIRTLPITGDAAQRGSEGMIGYRSLALDYVNIHFTIPSGLASNTAMTPSDTIKDNVEWLKDYTGHRNVISNEWHQELGGTVGDEEDLCADTVRGMREAHMKVAIIFSGDGGSDALTFVDPATNLLTALGIAYRDAIHS